MDFYSNDWREATHDQEHAYYNDLLPQEPFIAVFGSSHSYGSCKWTDSKGTVHKRLPDGHSWTEKLQAESGYPVVNFSKPGIDNLTMQMMITEFFRLPRSANCIHVISEIRFNELTLSFSHDVPIKFGHQVGHQVRPALMPAANFGALAGSKLATSITDNISFKGGYNPTVNYIGDSTIARFPVTKQGKSLETILKTQAGDIVNIAGQPASDAIAEYSKLHTLLKFHTLNHYMESSISVLGIQETVIGRGIPFNWFCWDLKIRGPIIKHIKQELYNVIDTKYPYLTQYEIPHSRNGMVDAYLHEEGGDNSKLEELPQCECGHYKEPVHTFVKDRVINLIKPKTRRDT